jgi:hypothetical protein
MFVVLVVAVAAIAGAAHELGVDVGERVSCLCRTPRLVSNILVAGIPVSLIVSWFAIPITTYVRNHAVRWSALLGLSLVPFLLLVDQHPRICHVALAPCMIAATLVERWTRQPPVLPMATMMRRR